MPSKPFPRWLRQLRSSDVTRFQEANLDFKVLAFTAAVAIGAGCACRRLAGIARVTHGIADSVSA